MSKPGREVAPRRTARKGHGWKEKAKRQTGTVQNLPVLRPNAAGIDIGSEELWVAVPADRDAEPVRCFSSFTNGLRALAAWLKHCGIETVALESTGVLWIPVFQLLAEEGFEVCLVNARHYQNVPGKRTDIGDCQWLQFLHSVGLMRASFRPQQAVCAVRSLIRHREQLVEMRSQHIQHMHKALDQMNLKLHYMLNDIKGASGQRMVRAILDGERDTTVLAEMRDRKVQATAEQIQESLVGDYREEHLFTLRQSFDFYQEYSRKIEAVDAEIEKYTAKLKGKVDWKEAAGKLRKVKKTSAERRHLATMKEQCRRVFGVDITRIPGFCRGGHAQKLVGEVGPNLGAFWSAEAFASWLGLCPNHEISGGKVLSRTTKKVKHPAATVFRMAAQSLQKSQTHLGRLYRSLRAKLGPPKAITAMAHKLARIFYHMVTRQEEYNERVFQKQEEMGLQRMQKRLAIQAAQLGLRLVAAK